MQLRRLTAALLPLSTWLAHAPMARGEDAETVSVFLPYYSEKWWTDMHGSVISKDEEKTEYTIFCPVQTPQRCNLAGETPFTFTEGPETLIIYATQTSSYIFNLECDLDGQTAATCSGYSSLASGRSIGMHTGPTEITWKSTFTGSDVAWAAITLTDEVPKQTNAALLDMTATPMETPEPTTSEDEESVETTHHGVPSEDSIFPQETDGAEGKGSAGTAGRWWGVAVGVAGVLAGAVL